MPETAGAELDALTDEFYEVWFRYRPDLALAAGVTPKVRWLPAQDDDEAAAQRGWLESLVLGLEEIDFPALDPDRQLDAELMAGTALVEHAELLDYDWRRRDPGRYLPTAEICRLTLTPPESLRAPLAEILTALPQRLRQAQSSLRQEAVALAPALVSAAAREAEDGRRYLRDLIRTPWLRQRCHGYSALETLTESAREALAGYREFLLRDLAPAAAGGLGCGPGHLRRRLAFLHFMDGDPRTLDEPLARALDATRHALEGIPDPESPQDEGTCPLPAEAVRLRWQQRVCDNLAAELVASALATLPEAPLRVAAAPVWPSPCPSEAEYAVDWGGAAPDGGTLFLPAPGSAGEARTPADVRAHCLAKGWGGSHLLAWSAPRQARRLARRVCNGASLTGAWGLYLDLRLAQGTAGGGARRESAMRRALLRRHERLTLARLDLDVHLGRIDGEQAAARLATAGLGPDATAARLAQIARAPGDLLAEGLGLCLLEEARARRGDPGRPAADECAFNDRLLGQGAIPLPLALARGFGEPLRRAAWDAVRGIDARPDPEPVGP